MKKEKIFCLSPVDELGCFVRKKREANEERKKQKQNEKSESNQCDPGEPYQRLRGFDFQLSIFF